MQMNDKSKSEKWDYIIDGKETGLTRLVVMGVIALFFMVLMVDQLKSGINKSFIVAVVFGSIATISLSILTTLIVRYSCFKIWIGKEGFCVRTNPFNCQYYKYVDIRNCDEILTKSQHRTVSGSRETNYRYDFIITAKNGETRRIKFDKSVYEHEFNVLRNRINGVE